MACNNNLCLDEFGCPDPSSGTCPDFSIKRYDTFPSFDIVVADCDGPLDLTDTVVEVSMWANAKLKKDIASDDVFISFADNIGFQQCMENDIIIVNRVRLPEQMLVTGFDETNKLIRVTRAYGGTTASDYKKGQKLKIFRVLNSTGSTKTTLTDVPQLDGTTTTDVITESQLSYLWTAQDTCLPGCYRLEFKLLKMISSNSGNFLAPYQFLAISPSIVSATMNCDLGIGVEWVRRFPTQQDGYLIQIIDTQTSESLV